MSRRRTVVLSSAAALFIVGLAAVLAVVGVTQTVFGREQVRRLIESELTSRIQGSLYIGRLSGGFLTGVTIDSVEIRDRDDSLFIATGPVTLEYDARDLLDRRILMRRVSVERPVVHVKQEQDGSWNWRRIFPGGRPRARVPGRGFGAYIAADSLTVRDGTFLLTLPWGPADSLAGARREAAIAENLARTDAIILADGDGYTRTRRWDNGQLAASGVRITHPDSSGIRIGLERLDVEGNDPPFAFSDVRGDVRILSDSVWFSASHWDLPASTGNGEAKIVWGSGLPIRYDVRVRGDSVSFSDVAWIYETLPRTGGGSLQLHIRNDPANLRVMDYVLTEVDARTTASALRGRMTWSIGGPVLALNDVDMELDPVDFALLRTLNGEPFPYDWAGTITGRVRGAGGALNRFRVDSASIVFRDANVPGALIRGSGRGELDVLDPALTVFRGFRAEIAELDLRTLRFLYSDFPRLQGTVLGSATLDSLWLDVRFSHADLTHRDGGADSSRFTGSGRVTFAEPFLRYDLELVALPLSFTALAGSYPRIPVRGSYGGPVRVRGTLDSLGLAAHLTGAAGTMAVDAVLDGVGPIYRARGSAALDSVNLAGLFERLRVPQTSLAIRSTFDIRGGALADAEGELAADVERSLVDGVEVYPSWMRLRLGGGMARLDTLELRTSAFSMTADGGLGLTPAHRDSISYMVRVDSLGGLRRYLGASPADRLLGSLTLNGMMGGSSSGVDLTGIVAGSSLAMSGITARRLEGSFVLADALGERRGAANLRADSLRLGRIRLQYVNSGVELHDRSRGTVLLTAVSANGPEAVVAADFTRHSTGATVIVDSVGVTVGDELWSLTSPATFSLGLWQGGWGVDSLELRDDAGGVVTIAGSVPAADSVTLRMRASGVPLRELGILAQTRSPLDGMLSLAVHTRGTRDVPTIELNGALDAARFGDVRLARATIEGSYANRGLTTRIALSRSDSVLLRATTTLPLDLALARRGSRILDGPISGFIRSEQVDLSVIEAFTTAVREASGNFLVNLDLGGTLDQPEMRGGVQVVGGAALLPGLGGVNVSDFNADVRFEGDSLHVRRFDAATRTDRAGSLALSGGIGFADRRNPRFDFTLLARDFHAIARPRVADLDVSTAPSLRLAGTLDGATLTGGIRVERGTIYLPELTQKRVIDLDDPEFYNVVDTTLVANRALLPGAPSSLLRDLSLSNVGVEMGSEVWLRGPDANINLGGRLNLTTTRDDRLDSDAGRAARLALDGLLTADRGTYRLNLNVVQRTFEIEQGSLRFFGDADFNPSLDISAIHTVRPYDPRAARQDVRIRAVIGGTLVNPLLELSSADDLQLSESDLISYLVVGAPSFAIGTARASEVTAAQLALTSLGSYLGARAAGGVFDVVQFQTSGVDQSALGDARSAGASILSGTRLGLGVQLSERTFVSADAGLCQFGNVVGGDAFNATDFAESIGVKVDYRLNAELSLSAGVEPSTSQRFCRADQGARGFAPTPRQFTFDLFRTWRF